MDGGNTQKYINPQLLQEFDSYLQRNAFRHLHMKLPLLIYKTFVFLWIKLPRNLSDWLYADIDFFLASMGSESDLTFWPENLEKPADFGLIILGKIEGRSHGIYMEERLVGTYHQYTVQFIFLRIPEGRVGRQDMTNKLLHEYEEYLSSREFKLFCKEVFQDTFRNVQESAPGNTATLGLSATVSTFGHATAGFAFTLAVDAIITIRALSRARKLRKAGEISEVEFRETVKRKVRQASCQLVAVSTGSMIGQIVIPVPVVGAMIGGFVGGLIGTSVNKGIDKVEEVQALKTKPSTNFTRKRSQNSPLSEVTKKDSHAGNSTKGLVDFAKKLVKTSDENISQISSKLSRKFSTALTREQNITKGT